MPGLTEADRPQGQVIKKLAKYQASVNAMEKHAQLLFLHILPDSNQHNTDNAAKTLKYPFSYMEFL